MSSRLEKFYKDEVVPALMKQFGYTNAKRPPTRRSWKTQSAT